MVTESQKREQEKSVLRWGGLAGLAGCIVLVLAWVIVIAGPVGMDDPSDLAGWVTRFPDIQLARVVENITVLVGYMLGIPLFLALFWSLRRTSLAPALFGSVLGILGLTVMMVGATPHVAHAPLSDLYHASGATLADQAALALMWQGTYGIFWAQLYVGFFVVPIGILLVGIAMFAAPTFGKGLGVASVGLGVAGLVAAVGQLVDPASMIGAAAYFAFVIFYLLLGTKAYRLSKAR